MVACQKALLISILLCLLMISTSLAVDLKVPSEHATITDALAVAEDGDFIIVATGIYSVDSGESFPLRLEKSITIQAEPGTQPHIKGDQEHTVVLIESGGAVLRGFRITDGLGSEGINSMDGGGICVFVGPSETKDVKIEDCIIENNTCPTDETYDGSGGGIYCGGTYCTCFQIHISNSIIRNNIVCGQGGGIFCALLSNVHTTDTSIESNTAEDHGGGVFVDVYASINMKDTSLLFNKCPGDPLRANWGGKGGGLACDSYGIFTASNCTIQENTARYFGGGIFTRGGIFEGEDLCTGSERFPYVSNSLINKNHAGLSGGGVYVSSSGTLNFAATKLYWNEADKDGGGVFVAGGVMGGGQVHFAVDPNDCTLEGNECGNRGGAVFIGMHARAIFKSGHLIGNSALWDGGAVFLETEGYGFFLNCLIDYNNSARGNGGGIRAEPGSMVEMKNCSVVGNFAPLNRSGLYLDNEAIVSITDSILWRNAGGSVEVNGAIISVKTTLNEDGSDPANGVIDGSPGYVGWGNLENIYVDQSSAGSGIGTAADPFRDLQVGLNAFDFSLSDDSVCIGAADDGGNLGAKTGIGGTAGNIIAILHLAGGTYDIRGRSIIFTQGVEGIGPENSTITNAVFGYIEDTSIKDLSITAELIFGGIVIRENVLFDNCNIHHNNAKADGGGIYVAGYECSMIHSSVFDNTSDPGNGGGLFALPESDVFVAESQINSNSSSGAGGGMFLDDNTNSSVTQDSMLSSNQAKSGGGIYIRGSLNASDSYFEINGATRGGGIFVSENAIVEVADCNFVSNGAGEDGGALECFGNVKLNKCLFKENIAKFGGAIDIKSPGIVNCRNSIFIKNNTRKHGGAVYIAQNTEKSEFFDCMFKENMGVWGGAVLCWFNSKSEFNDCKFTHNSSAYGGTLFIHKTVSRFLRCSIDASHSNNHGGSLYIQGIDESILKDCSITNSTASRDGGGVFIKNAARTAFRNTTVINCTAQNDGGGFYIRNTAVPNFSDVTISDCQAIYGGGVYARETTQSTFEKCKLTNNVAFELTISADGGGAYFTENAKGSFMDCEFSGNFAQDDGGGIGVAEEAIVDVQNTLFTKNTAVNAGGGAHFTYESIGTFTNCTIASNEATHSNGGGIYLEIESHVKVDSSIIWQNIPDGIRPDADPNIMYSCTQIEWPGTGNMIEDPYFADPDNNGYHLKSITGRWVPQVLTWMQDSIHSPCIDTGNPNLDWTLEPWPHGKRINMGAYGGTAHASMSLSDIGNMADLNHDDTVNFLDFVTLTQSWLTSPDDSNWNHICDLLKDNSVDLGDLLLFTENWLKE